MMFFLALSEIKLYIIYEIIFSRFALAVKLKGGFGGPLAPSRLQQLEPRAGGWRAMGGRLETACLARLGGPFFTRPAGERRGDLGVPGRDSPKV